MLEKSQTWRLASYLCGHSQSLKSNSNMSLTTSYMEITQTFYYLYQMIQIQLSLDDYVAGQDERLIKSRCLSQT